MIEHLEPKVELDPEKFSTNAGSLIKTCKRRRRDDDVVVAASSINYSRFQIAWLVLDLVVGSAAWHRWESLTLSTPDVVLLFDM